MSIAANDAQASQRAEKARSESMAIVAYMTYVTGNFFLDALVKADFLNPRAPGCSVCTGGNFGSSRFEASIIPSVWHILDRSGGVGIRTASVQFVGLEDSGDRTWGEVSGILNVFGASDKMSAFMKGDYHFGGDMKGYGVRAGAASVSEPLGLGSDMLPRPSSFYHVLMPLLGCKPMPRVG